LPFFTAVKKVAALQLPQLAVSNAVNDEWRIVFEKGIVVKNNKHVRNMKCFMIFKFRVKKYKRRWLLRKL
jgi:hypothetical protein